MTKNKKKPQSDDQNPTIRPERFTDTAKDEDVYKPIGKSKKSTLDWDNIEEVDNLNDAL